MSANVVVNEAQEVASNPSTDVRRVCIANQRRPRPRGPQTPDTGISSTQHLVGQSWEVSLGSLVTIKGIIVFTICVLLLLIANELIQMAFSQTPTKPRKSSADKSPGEVSSNESSEAPPQVDQPPPPTSVPSKRSALDEVLSMSREELLSALHPFKQLLSIPSVVAAYRALVAKEKVPLTEFPTLPWIQISDDKMVHDRNIKVKDVYTCFGREEDDGRSQGLKEGTLDGGFDFVFYPIGCFGDPVPRPRTQALIANLSCEGVASPSCKLGRPMAKFTTCAKKAFGAILGDNFYPNGITGWRDMRLEEEMMAKFWIYPSLRDGVKYYATAGNHDLKPKYQFRTDHNNWVMPDTYHASPMMRVGETTVQLFLISTQWGYHKNDPYMATMAAWLDKELEKSTAHWKIVGSHEQIFGFMGFEHGTGLIDSVHPVLIKHNVRLFVCAHQHSVHMFMTPGNYYHLVSAGFSEANVHGITKPRRPPGYYHQGQGATAILLSKEVAHVVAFDADENIIFSHKIRREVPSALAQPTEQLLSDNEHKVALAAARLQELADNGIDPADPMWHTIGSKCDRFRLKKSFINGTHWDRNASDGCFMYKMVGEKEDS